MNFYISDLHLGQDELFYTLTPTERVSTEEIIEAINSRCNRHDTLYVVGDISGYGVKAYQYVKRLKPKLVLVVGNHDHACLKSKKLRGLFEEITTQKYLTDKVKGEGVDLLLSHYPIIQWDGYYKGRWLFYGHIHDMRSVELYDRTTPTAINVGVDRIGPAPMTAEELILQRKEQFKWLTKEQFSALYQEKPNIEPRNTRKVLDTNWF